MSQGVTLCDSDTDPHNGPTGCFTQQWSSHGKSHACPPPPVLLQPLAIRQSLNARVARFCKTGRVTFAFELTKTLRLGDGVEAK